MARSLSPCLYCDRVSDGANGPPDPSIPWHALHRSRKMPAPAFRSSSLASVLNRTLASKPPPSAQLNPLPGRVNSQSSIIESSETSLSAFFKYSLARHETAFQIFSLMYPLYFGSNYSNRGYNNKRCPDRTNENGNGEDRNCWFLYLHLDVADPRLNCILSKG